MNETIPNTPITQDGRELPVYVRESLYRMARAMAHLWFWAVTLEAYRTPNKFTCWVYGDDRGVDHKEFKAGNKRIRITLEVEEPGA